MGDPSDLENAVVIDDKSTIIRLPDPLQQQEEQGPVRLNLARIAVANMDSNDNQMATLCYEVDGFGDGQVAEGELIAEVVTGEDVVHELGVTDAGEWVSECYTCYECDFVAMSKNELTVQQLEQKLRRYINKSRPFFDERNLCIGQLSAQKDRITALQKQVISMKEFYAASLKELESISEEIHRKRRTNTSSLSLDQPESEGDSPKGPREPGVGAELTPVFKEEPAMFQEKKTPGEVPEESKPATEGNCDIFYFEPKKSPGRASHAPLPLLDNLALVRKSEDGPEVPIPCASSGFAHWTDDFKAELDKFDLTSLGSMSVATGSSAVSELGEGDEVEDLSDFQGSLGMLSLQSPGALMSESMPASPTRAGQVNPGCLTPPPSPAHTITSSKVVFSTDAPNVIPEERLDCPVLTDKKVDENCSL